MLTATPAPVPRRRSSRVAIEELYDLPLNLKRLCVGYRPMVGRGFPHVVKLGTAVCDMYDA